MSIVQRKYLDTPQSRKVELDKLLSYLLNLGSGEGKLLWSNRAAHGVVLLQLFNPTLHGGEGVIMTPYHSVETNIYFGTNRISNIIRLMKIERIKYRILFAHQENIRILFEYLKIFEYSNIFE